MMRAGLFGGDWEDYHNALQDAVENAFWDSQPAHDGPGPGAYLSVSMNGSDMTAPGDARPANSGVESWSEWNPPDGAMAEDAGVSTLPSANPVQLFASAQPVAMKIKENWDNPANRQQEIDDALKANHLNSHGWPVRYYPNMGLGTDSYGNSNQDPGRTTSGVGVQLGPNAFTGSYGNFLSTLEHEVGAHTGQLANKTFSGPGPGHIMNEVEAYDRELQYAKDHGLTDKEIGGIHSNRNYYFNQLEADDQARVNNGIYTPHK